MALTTEINFLTALEAGIPRAGCHPGWFLMRLFFLAFRRLHPYLAFPLCVKRVGSGVSSSHNDTNLTGWGCTLKTLFHPNCLLKGPSSDIVTLGVRACEFRDGIQISPNNAPNNRSISGVMFISRSAMNKVKKFLLSHE